MEVSCCRRNLQQIQELDSDAKQNVLLCPFLSSMLSDVCVCVCKYIQTDTHLDKVAMLGVVRIPQFSSAFWGSLGRNKFTLIGHSPSCPPFTVLPVCEQIPRELKRPPGLLGLEKCWAL